MSTPTKLNKIEEFPNKLPKAEKTSKKPVKQDTNTFKSSATASVRSKSPTPPQAFEEGIVITSNNLEKSSPKCDQEILKYSEKKKT